MLFSVSVKERRVFFDFSDFSDFPRFLNRHKTRETRISEMSVTQSSTQPSGARASAAWYCKTVLCLSSTTSSPLILKYSKYSTLTLLACLASHLLPLFQILRNESTKVQYAAGSNGGGTLFYSVMLLIRFMSKPGSRATVHISHRSTSLTMIHFSTYFISIGHFF